MSPDIEWHVGEESDKETVATATSPRRSRRSWIAVLIVVMLGASLGMVYRAIPEPAPRPTPTPAPTATPEGIPAKLYDVIEREARALATGNGAALAELQNFANFQEQRYRLTESTAWGVPLDRPLYEILGAGLLAEASAWAEIRQSRHGADFRETRFYQLRNGQWRRSGADARFWQDTKQTADTAHFRVIYAAEDRNLVVPLLIQFEQDYEQICADLGCPAGERHCVESLGQQWCSIYPREYTTTLQLDRASWNTTTYGGQNRFDIVFELPSPRIIGLYESNYAVHYGSYTDLIIVPLSQVWYLAYGEALFRSLPPEIINEPLVYAITLRELEHLQTQRGAAATQWDILLNGKSDWDGTQYLESLWMGPVQQATATRVLDAYWFAEFLEQEFGRPAFATLLRNMRVVSPYTAFEDSLDVSFDEVQRRWTAWLNSRRK